MTPKELKEIAQSFGKVTHCELSNVQKNGARLGKVEYSEPERLKKAQKKLRNRRVDGWHMKLAAQIINA